MNEELLKTLVERNLITTNTILYAKVRSKQMDGGYRFTNQRVYYYPGMPAEAIKEIEGMTPDRFAKAYNIKPDGSLQNHKKRGRKPKMVA